MKQTMQTAVSVALAALLCIISHVPTDAFAQTQEMIRRLQSSTQGGSMSQPTVDVPGLGGDTGQLRPSDLLPDEMSLTYPLQSDILFDQQIDPSKYILGPGDLVGVYLWGEIDRGYLIRVSPEGYLVIPTVGSIVVAEYSLAAASDLLGQDIHSKYPGLDYSLVLIEPRRFRLYVSGLVYLPGMHDSHALERVSDVLDRAGLILPGRVMDKISAGNEEKLKDAPEEQLQASTGILDDSEYGVKQSKRVSVIGAPRAGMLGREKVAGKPEVVSPEELFTLGSEKGASIRSIIIHRGEKTIHADLLRFTKLGDLEANPYMNSGDHVEIVSYKGDISIFGEVNDEGMYEFKPGDRICDLIGFGGGLTAQADSSKAELVRAGSNGRSLNRIEIDLHDALHRNPDSSEYVLQESDPIYIRPGVNAKKVANVEVRGQVRYPGVYPIVNGQTTLTDLMRMAGGLSGNESLGQARLFRDTVPLARDLEYERLKTVLLADRAFLENDYVRSYQRTLPGTINVDFISLFRDKDMTQDVILQDNDIIVIPQKSDYVNVIGAVLEPKVIKVKEGEDFLYYIEQAGDFSSEANKRYITISKASTGQVLLVMKEDVKIEGGDTLHVPTKYRRSFWSYVSLYSGYFTMVATVVVLGLQISR